MGRRNPNGYGCVTKLSGKRSKPWAVKVTLYDEQGKGKQVTIDTAETKAKGNIILAQYNDRPWNIDRNKITLVELYKKWDDVKAPKLGSSNRSSLRSAYKHLSKYYGKKYREIRAYQMQETIDNCGHGYSTQATIKNLWRHLDHFAYETDIIDKMYSELLSSDSVPETSRTPFTPEQIEKLWKLQSDKWVKVTLIYIYTGFRLTELLGMKKEQVDTKDWYFKGGIKSDAGRGRIVPIHERIKPLVKSLLRDEGAYLITDNGNRVSQSNFYLRWGEVMNKIGADKTPHEARHTFETALDNLEINRKIIDMLMGHKSKDVGNRVYNHKTIDQLRAAVNMITDFRPKETKK